MAYRLGMLFYVFNFAEDFRREVIERFVQSYENGTTPNPCIDCNRFLKFDRLYRRGRELGFDYTATGHYARIERDSSGRYLLKKAYDLNKDQSYVLYAMTQEQLAHTKFPLGELTKPKVRRDRRGEGLSERKKTRQSGYLLRRERKIRGFYRIIYEKIPLARRFRRLPRE